jgi:hypothetical protein
MHHGFRNVVSDIGTSTRDIVSDVRQVGAENLAATDAVGMATLKGFCDVGMALQKDTCDINKSVFQTGDVIQDDIKDFALSNLEHQRDILSSILIQGGKNSKATRVTARETQLKVISQANKSRDTTREESYKLQLGQKELLLEGRDTRERILDKICDSDRRSVKQTAAILLDACRNKEQISKQIDDCCCDLKLLITNESNVTRDLILEQTIESLEAQVALLTAQLIAATGSAAAASASALTARATGILAQPRSG